MSDSLAVVRSEPPKVNIVDDVTVVVRRVVGSDLTIESVEVPREARMGVLTLRGRLTIPSHVAFRRWLAELRPLGYTPMLRHDATNGDDAVALYIYPIVPPQLRSRPWINVILFLLTVISTLFVGELRSTNLDGVTGFADLFLPHNLLMGWPFSLTLLTILLAHEFGHYFAARYHKVAVSLPFFIPFPSLVGTLGAFIRFREPVPDRRKLFDIGIAGPLAGLVVAIPLLFLGLATSPVDIPPQTAGIALEGNSLAYFFAKLAVFGKVLPNPLTGEDVFINQVAFAAWFGLLMTAINLLPVGQLDGGHTVYALFGNNARYINWVTLFGMALLAIASLPQVQTFWPALKEIGFLGWWVWLFLLIFIIGPYHPPALDDVTQLDSRRVLVGYLVILCFIVTFVPTPMREL